MWISTNILFAFIDLSIQVKKMRQISRRPTVLALVYSFINAGKQSYIKEQLDFFSMRQQQSPELHAFLQRNVKGHALTSLSLFRNRR